MPAPLHGQGRAADAVGKRVHGRGGRARAGFLPRLHPDRASRRRRPRTASTGRRTSTATSSRTPCTSPTAAPRCARPAVADQPEVRPSRTRRPPRSRACPTRRSPGGCRSARSCTRAPATRAATPTSASGSGPASARTSAPSGCGDRRAARDAGDVEREGHRPEEERVVRAVAGDRRIRVTVGAARAGQSEDRLGGRPAGEIVEMELARPCRAQWAGLTVPASVKVPSESTARLRPELRFIRK